MKKMKMEVKNQMMNLENQILEMDQMLKIKKTQMMMKTKMKKLLT